MADVQALTGTTFKETIAKGTTLVDFWAEWCGPCRQQGPIVDELSAKVSDQHTIAKLDVDAEENRQIAVDYEVTSIPTLILFKDGQLVKRLVGLQPLSVLEEELASL